MSTRPNSALFPFISQPERAAGFARSDSPNQKLSKLEALLAQSTGDPEHIAILANLLSLPASDQPRLQDPTTDLAGLWMKQDRRLEAINLLGDTCGRLVAGIDTQDFENAKMVLDELTKGETGPLVI